MEDFVPERYLAEEPGQQLPTVGFGYGRRVCPGQHVARDTLWIIISRLLWAFDVKPGISSFGEGDPISTDSTKCTDGLVTKPLPFTARFEPRGEWASQLVAEQCDTVDVDIVSMLDSIGAGLSARWTLASVRHIISLIQSITSQSRRPED